MPNEKKIRKFISLQTKIQILDRLKNQEKTTDVAKYFNLNESTIRTIKQTEEKMRNSVASGSSVLAKITARPRANIMEKMEQALIVWVEDMTKKRLPLDGNVIKEKALKIFKYLKEMGESSADEPSHKFVASNGGFEKFKKRHSLHNIKLQGEKASADVEGAKLYPGELAKIIQEKGYSANQVFNADETGLWWKKMPSRTYISKNEKIAPGFKAAKDRFTLLFCSNASGDFMTKPIFINRSLNPRALKRCNKNRLPVYWRANKKAWMTGNLFNDWFHHCFVPDVENYLKKKNVAFKVLLILDNAPSHSCDLNHPNVQISFLPPNTTSLLQPLDQGIIANFKSIYIRRSFQLILDKIDTTDITISEVWKQFSILDCVEIVASSIKEMRQSTLNACWKVVLPEMVNQRSAVEPTQVGFGNILNIAHAIGRDGFDEITLDDIEELVTEDEINEADLVAIVSKTLPIEDTNSEDISDYEDKSKKFTVKCVEKGLDMAKQLANYFLENEPLEERAQKFTRNLENCLSPYDEIYKDLLAKRKQFLITDFIKPITIARANEPIHCSSSSDSDVAPAKRSRHHPLSSDEEEFA